MVRSVIPRLKALLERIRMYLRITRMGPIARRYFVKNGFDGSMTMLGIVVGSWVVGVERAEIIVTAGLGACLAMGISGLFGAYMTERAERKRELKSLENAMITDLHNSVLNDASSFVSFFAAIIDGGSPILTGIISLLPFVFTLRQVLAIGDAYVLSFTLTLITLFILGMYLGTVAKENAWLYGIQTLVAGIITVAIAILLGAI